MVVIVVICFYLIDIISISIDEIQTEAVKRSNRRRQTASNWLSLQCGSVRVLQNLYVVLYTAWTFSNNLEATLLKHCIAAE